MQVNPNSYSEFCIIYFLLCWTLCNFFNFIIPFWLCCLEVLKPRCDSYYSCIFFVKHTNKMSHHNQKEKKEKKKERTRGAERWLFQRNYLERCSCHFLKYFVFKSYCNRKSILDFFKKIIFTAESFPNQDKCNFLHFQISAIMFFHD